MSQVVAQPGHGGQTPDQLSSVSPHFPLPTVASSTQPAMPGGEGAAAADLSFIMQAVPAGERCEGAGNDY